MKKYKYYLMSLIGLIVMFYGAFHSLTIWGITLYFIGMIVSLIGILLQISVPFKSYSEKSTFKCPDCCETKNRWEQNKIY